MRATQQAEGKCRAGPLRDLRLRAGGRDAEGLALPALPAVAVRPGLPEVPAAAGRALRRLSDLKRCAGQRREARRRRLNETPADDQPVVMGGLQTFETPCKGTRIPRNQIPACRSRRTTEPRTRRPRQRPGPVLRSLGRRLDPPPTGWPVLADLQSPRRPTAAASAHRSVQSHNTPPCARRSARRRDANLYATIAVGRVLFHGRHFAYPSRRRDGDCNLCEARRQQLDLSACLRRRPAKRWPALQGYS